MKKDMVIGIIGKMQGASKESNPEITANPKNVPNPSSIKPFIVDFELAGASTKARTGPDSKVRGCSKGVVRGTKHVSLLQI